MKQNLAWVALHMVPLASRPQNFTSPGTVQEVKYELQPSGYCTAMCGWDESSM